MNSLMSFLVRFFCQIKCKTTLSVFRAFRILELWTCNCLVTLHVDTCQPLSPPFSLSLTICLILPGSELMKPCLGRACEELQNHGAGKHPILPDTQFHENQTLRQ